MGSEMCIRDRLVGGPTPWGNHSPFNFGAPGLVLATVAINLLTCLALLVGLQQKVGGLPLRRWGWTCCGSPSPEFWQRGVRGS